NVSGARPSWVWYRPPWPEKVRGAGVSRETPPAPARPNAGRPCPAPPVQEPFSCTVSSSSVAGLDQQRPERAAAPGQTTAVWCSVPRTSPRRAGATFENGVQRATNRTGDCLSGSASRDLDDGRRRWYDAYTAALDQRFSATRPEDRRPV